MKVYSQLGRSVTETSINVIGSYRENAIAIESEAGDSLT